MVGGRHADGREGQGTGPQGGSGHAHSTGGGGSGEGPQGGSSTSRSCRVSEGGQHINTEVTAPGATMALALMFIRYGVFFLGTEGEKKGVLGTSWGVWQEGKGVMEGRWSDEVSCTR